MMSDGGGFVLNLGCFEVSALAGQSLTRHPLLAN